jgi:hypothetical protein
MHAMSSAPPVALKQDATHMAWRLQHDTLMLLVTMFLWAEEHDVLSPSTASLPPIVAVDGSLPRARAGNVKRHLLRCGVHAMLATISQILVVNVKRRQTAPEILSLLLKT